MEYIRVGRIQFILGGLVLDIKVVNLVVNFSLSIIKFPNIGQTAKKARTKQPIQFQSTSNS